MSNTPLKVCSTKIQGDLFQTAINDQFLAIDSRRNGTPTFSVFDHQSGHLVAEISDEELDHWYTLSGIENQALILQHFENKKNPDVVSFHSINWETGDFGIYEKDIAPSDINIPSWIPADSIEFEPIVQFLGKEVVLGCEYLEWSETIIFSYYLSVNETYDRYLIYLKDGSEIYHEKIDEGLKGIAPGSFFTFKNRLIFARDKNEINIYEI